MGNQGNQRRDLQRTFATSFADVVELDEIQVVGTLAESILRDNGGELEKAKASLIEAVRSGKHIELRARATTFRQKDGAPNKNFVRFKSGKLGDIAASFVGKPFLLNHDKYSQESRMGTIVESEAVPLAGGWTGFRQTLHVVKPHAVISVLDGTIDRFSIGWDPRGQVICTAHKVDVRSRSACWRMEGCYPGKSVDIDGEAKIAEYEWQSTEGTEASAVNAPAVSGTKIDNIAALADALGLPDDEPTKEPRTMKLPALLAALGMKKTQRDLSDDDDDELAEAATAIVEERNAAASNLAKLSELTKDRDTLAARVIELEGSQVDSLIELAYKSGKLVRGKDEKGQAKPSARESRLRRIAKVDGISGLQAEIDEMPQMVPVGRAALADEDPNPRVSSGAIPSSVLASTAKQLGIKPEDLEAHANQLYGRESGEN